MFADVVFFFLTNRSLSPLARGGIGSNSNRGAGAGAVGGGKGFPRASDKEEGVVGDVLDSRRSRSSGIGVNRRGLSKISQSLPPRDRVKSKEVGGGGVEGSQLDGPGADGAATTSGGGGGGGGADNDAPPVVDEISVQNDSLLRSLPSDVFKAVLADRGGLSSHGILLTSNPLQLLPPEMYDVMATVQDSGLSDSKKLEWNLDIIREYDEKRLDRCESFLVSQRHSSYEIQLEYVNQPLKQLYKTKKMHSQEESRPPRLNGDYYKDKGRFPSRCSL